ncbi:MAG: PIG-L family deacetylase [Phycisphaerales bacterium]
MMVLVFAPHPDDAELAMGGTIAKLVARGHAVTVCDLTDGAPTPFGSREIRARETAEATAVLGVQRLQAGLVNRELRDDLASRRVLATIIRSLQPDVVFSPYPRDAHPDHVAATSLVRDARFEAKYVKTDLPGSPCYPRWHMHYFATHLRIVAQPDFIVDTTGFTDAKQRAIACYASQVGVNPANRRLPIWIAAADTYFGSRIGAEAGEPFACDEPLDLAALGWL